MQELLIKIFIFIGILLFIGVIASVLWYSYRIPGSKKAIYISSIFMLLGSTSIGVVIYLIQPTMTLYFLLAGVGATGIYLISGLVTLAIRDKIADWLDQWLNRKS